MRSRKKPSRFALLHEERAEKLSMSRRPSDLDTKNLISSAHPGHPSSETMVHVLVTSEHLKRMSPRWQTQAEEQQ